MLQLLASTACYTITFETALGYPFGDQVSANLTPCNTCPNCTNKHLFPAIHQQGTKQLLFDLFVSGPNRIQGLMTVETVVEGMRKCQNVNKLLFKSLAVLVQKLQIHQVMFVLIAAGILTMDYRDPDITLSLGPSKLILSLLAMNDDISWFAILQKI